MDGIEFFREPNAFNGESGVFIATSGDLSPLQTIGPDPNSGDGSFPHSTTPGLLNHSSASSGECVGPGASADGSDPSYLSGPTTLNPDEGVLGFEENRSAGLRSMGNRFVENNRFSDNKSWIKKPRSNRFRDLRTQANSSCGKHRRAWVDEPDNRSGKFIKRGIIVSVDGGFSTGTAMSLAPTAVNSSYGKRKRAWVDEPDNRSGKFAKRGIVIAIDGGFSTRTSMSLAPTAGSVLEASMEWNGDESRCERVSPSRNIDPQTINGVFIAVCSTDLGVQPAAMKASEVELSVDRLSPASRSQ
ncbi:hypothetical protein QYF36_010582 [Acer negundo]|nr:hypothetical protein QYF36_010582 [Acer negundo]